MVIGRARATSSYSSWTMNKMMLTRSRCALRAHLGVGENYFLGPQKKFLCMQGSTQRGGGGGGCCPPEIFKAKTNIHSDFRFSNSCIS